MAFPVILVDSTNGAASDTAASGAGPTTALTGTLAATDGAGTTVTLDALTDLTGVATDGSAVIYLADTTAGHRRFAKITAKAGSGGATPTVTVSEAFTASLSGKAWAIGGVRATAFGSVSKLLVDNNTSAGDAKPGWTIQMQSGHIETISAAVDLRGAGDTTSGAITIEGKTGAATAPIITCASGGNGIVPRGSYTVVRGFWLKANASNATGIVAAITFITVSNMKIYSGTGTWTNGIVSAGSMRVLGCEIAGTTSHGISDNGSGGPLEILNNYIHDMASGTHDGINLSGDPLGFVIEGNIIARAGGRGIYCSSTATGIRSMIVAGNTIDSCGSDGIRMDGAGNDWLANLTIRNNILSNNGGYGLLWNQTTPTDAGLSAYGFLARNNNTYGNTSGAYKSNTGTYTNANCPWATGDPGLDPQFTNAAGGDFTIGTNLKAQGYPTSPVGT